MAEAAAADWERAFAQWLAPFLEALGHKTRQRWAPVYVRGLFIGPGGAEERAADGGTGRARGWRSAAPLHQQPGLADRPARGGAGARGGPPRGRSGRGADPRR